VTGGGVVLHNSFAFSSGKTASFQIGEDGIQAGSSVYLHGDISMFTGGTIDLSAPGTIVDSSGSFEALDSVHFHGDATVGSVSAVNVLGLTSNGSSTLTALNGAVVAGE